MALTTSPLISLLMPSTSPENSDSIGINAATLQFIACHRRDDVRQLALRGSHDASVNLQQALCQIEGWQKARSKHLPCAGVEGILYPRHLNMEQCSSAETAGYKAAIVARLLNSDSRRLLVDLTGGFGVDFSFLAPLFRKAVYVEQDASLCELARHNLALLGLEHAEVVSASAEHFLSATSSASLFFLDPARRNSYGGRTFAISDCQPDVLQLLEALLSKGQLVMLKLSPMLDLHRVVEELGAAFVAELHAVAVGNECKELLAVLSKAHQGLRIFCHNDTSTFDFSPAASVAVADSASPIEGYCLYEPNAAVMKAACFNQVAAHWQLSPVSANSHLFLSEQPVEGFPGRGFRILRVTSMNKRELRAALQGVGQANVSVRNFPMTAESLRRKLHLKDGGDLYIFATTLSNGRHTLIICKK